MIRLWERRMVCVTLLVWSALVFTALGGGAGADDGNISAHAYWEARLHGAIMPSSISAMVTPLSPQQASRLLIESQGLPREAPAFCKSARIKCVPVVPFGIPTNPKIPTNRKYVINPKSGNRKPNPSVPLYFYAEEPALQPRSSDAFLPKRRRPAFVPIYSEGPVSSFVPIYSGDPASQRRRPAFIPIYSKDPALSFVPIYSGDPVSKPRRPAFVPIYSEDPASSFVPIYSGDPALQPRRLAFIPIYSGDPASSFVPIYSGDPFIPIYSEDPASSFVPIYSGYPASQPRRPAFVPIYSEDPASSFVPIYSGDPFIPIYSKDPASSFVPIYSGDSASQPRRPTAFLPIYSEKPASSFLPIYSGDPASQPRRPAAFLPIYSKGPVPRLLMSPSAYKVGIFFREKQVLVAGREIYVEIASGTRYLDERAFLPRNLAALFPLDNGGSKIASLLGTPKESLRKALAICEVNMTGAEKSAVVAACLTSLEDAVDFVSNILGSSKPIKIYEGFANVSSHTVVGKSFNVVKVEVLNNLDEPFVICHDLDFPFRIFYCHLTKQTKNFAVTLEASDGSMHDRTVTCHYDTTYWHPHHTALQEFDLKPGEGEMCHWLGAGMWTKQNGWLFLRA